MIHDVSLGRGNVDHIAIGPGGVFTVETKSHPGPVQVGRVHGAVLGQAQAQRRAIERATGKHVEPLLVYSRAWVDRPLSRRKGVRVVPARMLLGYLDRQPQRLVPEEIEGARELLARAIMESAGAQARPWRTRGRRPARSGSGRRRASLLHWRAASTLPAPGRRRRRRRCPGPADADRSARTSS